MVDTADLKSADAKASCRFESGSGHQAPKQTTRMPLAAGFVFYPAQRAGVSSFTAWRLLLQVATPRAVVYHDPFAVKASHGVAEPRTACLTAFTDCFD